MKPLSLRDDLWVSRAWMVGTHGMRVLYWDMFAVVDGRALP